MIEVLNKKRILIISRSFYPMNSPRSFRTTELAKEFSRLGYEVTVYLPKFENEHSCFSKQNNINIRYLGEPNWKAIAFNSSNKIIQLLVRGFNRLFYQLFFYPGIGYLFSAKRIIKKEKKYDILLTIAAPHSIHWGASFSWKKNVTSKVWIADCGDPFMGATTDSFKPPFYFKYLEKRWCKICDHITVPFEGAKQGYYKEFRNKIKVIPQGFNFDSIKIDKTLYKSNIVPTFAYSGLLIPNVRDPRPLIEYLLSLKIDFKFVLYNKQKSMFNDLVKKANGKVEFRDYIPRSELMQVLSKMDFLINFNNNVSTQMPSKLIDYYLTGRPILSLNSYDLNEKVVKEFLNKDYENQYKIESPKQYRIENVAKEFIKIF